MTDFQIRIRDTVTPKGRKLAIVPLAGRLDAKAASSVRQTLQQVMGFGYAHLLLDLTQVSFIDSSGIGMLVATARKCRASGGNLCLCALAESVELALKFAAMDQVFPLFPEAQAAIDHFPE